MPQSGFRQKHNCQTALVKLIDQWMAGIDKGDTIGSMFINFRKAFDLDDHKILIQKLAAYRLSHSSLLWFISYLESRQQTIQYDRGMTTFSNILSGVPQGSILEPTLFLLFVNDLHLFLKHCYSDLFADDATTHTSSSDKNIINEEISTDLLQIVYWSQRNKLPINFDKTTYMLIRARKQLNDYDNLELNVGETSLKTKTFGDSNVRKPRGHHKLIICVQFYHPKYRFSNTYQPMYHKTCQRYIIKLTFYLY